MPTHIDYTLLLSGNHGFGTMQAAEVISIGTEQDHAIHCNRVGIDSPAVIDFEIHSVIAITTPRESYSNQSLELIAIEEHQEHIIVKLKHHRGPKARKYIGCFAFLSLPKTQKQLKLEWLSLEPDSCVRYSIQAQLPEFRLTKQVQQTDASRNATHPIRVFKIGDVHDEFKSFENVVIPLFRQLNWDYYDVRRAELQFIEALNKELTPAEHNLLLSYYRGEVAHEAIVPLLESLPEREPDKLLIPCRKKACTHLKITYQHYRNHWLVDELPVDKTAQNVDNADYRSISREYEQVPNLILEHPEFKLILSNVIAMVKEARPSATALNLSVWMMSCYTWPHSPSSNAPEGIHQDGADFIVSALVVERLNVTGGETKVFVAGDLEHPVVETVLQEGEGLFQSDIGSPLWHTVTNIQVSDEHHSVGIRNILGFDVRVAH